jgi:probable biosynthetic protein (TIGR04098 family)
VKARARLPSTARNHDREDGKLTAERLSQVLVAEIIGYRQDRDGETFENLGLDSFDLVNLRAAIEVAIGSAIDDADWIQCRTPADIRKTLAGGARSKPEPAAFESVRTYKIGMPQMAAAGLSEGWLFKEVGDFHWTLIANGLGVESSDMVDGMGNRLYATFTRFRIDSSVPLADFKENEYLEISGSLARYGAGQFLGTYDGKAENKSFTGTVLSSFSSRSLAESNKELQRGQPRIPPDCRIPLLTKKPLFVAEYQQRRSEKTFPAPLFSKDYQINPFVDINGVGLLYFAAYPTISDFCELSHFAKGSEWAFRASTHFRDVFYFANSDANDVLQYRLLTEHQAGSSVATESLIAREDGTPMALLVTRKRRLAT